jgi:hypothetical protein
MVFQRAPAAANVWGSGAANAGIQLTLSNEHTGVVVAGGNLTSTSSEDGSWSFKLPPIAASSNSYAITVSMGDSKAKLSDVLFGGQFI